MNDGSFKPRSSSFILFTISFILTRSFMTDTSLATTNETTNMALFDGRDGPLIKIFHKTGELLAEVKASEKVYEHNLKCLVKNLKSIQQRTNVELTNLVENISVSADENVVRDLAENSFDESDEESNGVEAITKKLKTH